MSQERAQLGAITLVEASNQANTTDGAKANYTLESIRYQHRAYQTFTPITATLRRIGFLS